jgi:hypothetical protein
MPAVSFRHSRAFENNLRLLEYFRVHRRCSIASNHWYAPKSEAEALPITPEMPWLDVGLRGNAKTRFYCDRITRKTFFEKSRLTGANDQYVRECS